jgi:copper(I)-binding protein
MNIHNNAQVQDSLSEAKIDICERTELHQTTIDDAGVMRMEHTERIDIPSDEMVSLEPGGYHVMCMGLQSQLQAGDRITITLSFAESGDLQVQAEIREQ